MKPSGQSSAALPSGGEVQRINALTFWSWVSVGAAGLSGFRLSLGSAERGEVVALFILFLSGLAGMWFTGRRRARDDARLQETAHRWRSALEAAGDGLWDWDLRTGEVHYSERWAAMLGCTVVELTGTPMDWETRLHPEDLPLAKAELKRHLDGETPAYVSEVRFRSREGAYLWMLHRGRVVERGPNGRPWRMVGTLVDITERHQARRFEREHKAVLEMIAGGTALPKVLEALVEVIESQEPDLRGSILLLDPDGRHLRHGAAPQLPEAYNRAIDGVGIGPCVGSCGTAAYRRESVHVADIATDPLWADYKELALAHGLRACWSTPVLDGSGAVLGTFAMYLNRTGLPSADHLRWIELATHTAAIAINRDRSGDILRSTEARWQTVVEQMSEGLILCDPGGLVLGGNVAAERMLGLDESVNWCRPLAELAEILELADLKGRRLPVEQWPLSRVLRGEVVPPMELRVTRKDLEWERVIRCHARLVRQSGDREIGLLTLMDVTDRYVSEQAVRRQAELRSLLLEVSRLILASGRVDAALIEAIYEQVRQPLQVDICFSYGVKANHDCLRLVQVMGLPEEYWSQVQQLEFGMGFCGTVARNAVPEIANRARIETDPMGGFMKVLGVRAFACHPLTYRDGNLRGTLSFGSRTRDSLESEELEFLQTLAHFVSLAWERAEAEAEVDEQQLLLRQTGTMAKVGGWSFDPQSGQGAWTEAVALIHGVDPSQPVSRDFGLRFYEGESRVRIEAAVRDAVEHGTPYDLELELVTAQGQRRWVRTIGSPLQVDGRVVRVRGSLQDITEHKLREREIQRLTRLHATLGELSETVVWVGSREELFREACRIAEQTAGFRWVWVGWLDTTTRQVVPVGEGRAGLVGTGAIKVYADDRPEGQGAVGRCLRTGAPCIINDFLSDPGSAPWREQAMAERLLAVAALPLRFRGAVVGCFAVYASEIGVFRDPEVALLERMAISISYALDHLAQEEERQRTEAALRESIQRFEIVSQATNDAVWDLSFATGMLWWNDGLRTLFGYALENPTTEVRWWSDRIHPEERARVEEHFYGLISGRDSHWSDEYRFQRADGTYAHIFDRGYLLRDGEGKVVRALGAMMDVTDRKRAESERQSLELQLRHAQKLEAVGQLSGGIAHDFNNILGAILGNAELAGQDLPAAHPASQCVSEILRAGQRAQRLVQQILLFSRRHSTERQVILLEPVLDEGFSLLWATIPAHVRLIKFVGPAVPAVLADPTQIHQVIVNLCTNAWHAMEGSTGRIDLRLERAEVTKDLARTLRVARPGTFACLTVADTGKGMDAAVRERMFEPFFTTKEPGQGTGLGLSVVHGIVEEHEGGISVESTPGVGTIFRVYLPEATAPVAAVPAPVHPPESGSGRRILYLDDEEAMVSVTRRALSRAGYVVIGFTRVTEGLAAFRADPLGFDAVVTDFNMPGHTGIQVAVEMKALRQDLPVVMTSGYLSESLRQQAEAAGINQLIHKPNQIEELTRVLPELLSVKA